MDEYRQKYLEVYNSNQNTEMFFFVFGGRNCLDRKCLSKQQEQNTSNKENEGNIYGFSKLSQAIEQYLTK